jgi:N-acetylneuraminic acid mutarotase
MSTMTTVLRVARFSVALAFAAVTAVSAFATDPQNHYILPCDQPCASARWEISGNLNIARRGHTATLLPNGEVLIVGGWSPAAEGYGPLASTERYDPATGTFRLARSLSTLKYVSSATALLDGRVLVIGSNPDSSVWMAAEIYDPTTDEWSTAADPGTALDGHSAVRLLDGRVLIAGAYAPENGVDRFIGSAMIYDSKQDAWSTTGALNHPRTWHTLTLLDSGEVLLVGGTDSGDLQYTLYDAEIYNPVSGEWRVAGRTSGGGVMGTATPLPDGTVLVAGGNGGGIGGNIVFDDVEVFDPEQMTWGRFDDLSVKRYAHSATDLGDGRVLIVGGERQHGGYPWLSYETLSSVEQFDPVTGRWIAAPRLNVARSRHTATLLRDGSVLVVGGSYGPGGGPNYDDYRMFDIKSAERYRVAGPRAEPLHVPGFRGR